MTVTNAAIRKGIGDNIRANVDDVQVSDYALSQPMAPGVQIVPGDAEFDRAMSGGYDSRMFTIQVFADFSGDIAPQMVVDAFMDRQGPRSIKSAVEDDRSLGGIVDDCVVRRHTGYRLVDRAGGGGQLIVVEFTVEVMAN